MFTISHKPVAEAAGLGRMGHHRLLIHPVLGSHLCLGTLVIDTALDDYDQPLDYSPCIGCNLCVGVCPTGAIAADGSFAFARCLIHAYRDRLGGFLSWVEALVSSGNMEEYRLKRTDGETMAVWQSLTYGGGYRCGYCMSVCPAGLDLIGPYLESRRGYLENIVRPLQDRKEMVYVLPGEDSEAAVARRFPARRLAEPDRTVRQTLFPAGKMPRRSSGSETSTAFGQSLDCGLHLLPGREPGRPYRESCRLWLPRLWWRCRCSQ